jgi:hypothetical protein
MEKNHRQGRPGAKAHALRRAYAQRLLATLIGICRHLRHLQPAAEVRAAYLQVEQDLVEHRRKQSLIRPVGRRSP